MNEKFIEALIGSDSHVDFDAVINQIARHGAKEALRDLGLDDPDIKQSIRDLAMVSDNLKELANTSDDLKEVANAWRALGWVRKAVLWLGGLAAGITAIYHAIGHNWFGK